MTRLEGNLVRRAIRDNIFFIHVPKCGGVIGDVALEQTLAVEVTEHPVSNRVLELVPVGGREVGGLVGGS